MKCSIRVAAAALTVSAVVPAFAYDCNDVSFEGGSVDYAACYGSFLPPSPSATTIEGLTGLSGLTGYKDDEDGDAPEITSVLNGAAVGSITFNVDFDDPFVIELKFGREWSAFLFDEGVSAGTTWDFALDTESVQGLGLSHVAVYGNAVPAIPEPSTYALMLAGLGVVGFVARRRQRA